ncbi:hypothetical protein KKF94_01615 [Patescibacteria group bacterium]|nr:hypothetical protein [Patescibacteria group bacterium]
MSENKLAKNKILASTQKYLDIAEIKNNTVIMRDGTIRAVLLVPSINFALKSEDEQNAIIASYVSFLNNLDFVIQIVIQSRELNIDNYLEQLKQKEKEQTNRLLKMQTSEYLYYINELISMEKIMNRRFYICIPYNPLYNSERKSFFKSLFQIFSANSLVEIKKKKFETYCNILNRRIDNIQSGLASMGLNAARLDTQSLIELFYNTYNPVVSLNQKLTDVNELRVE